MSEERRKILEMLSRGTITAEDAERLLDRLPAAREDPAGSLGGSRPLQNLRIHVESPGRDPVDVRIPLGFVRSGIALGAILPGQVRDRLRERGVDLSSLASLRGDDLVEALGKLDMQVEAQHGKTVRIYCE